MNIINKTSLASGGQRVWRDNGETDCLSLCRDGTRTQRSTVLRLFRVIKRCAFLRSSARRSSSMHLTSTRCLCSSFSSATPKAPNIAAPALVVPHTISTTFPA